MKIKPDKKLVTRQITKETGEMIHSTKNRLKPRIPHQATIIKDPYLLKKVRRANHERNETKKGKPHAQMF